MQSCGKLSTPHEPLLATISWNKRFLYGCIRLWHRFFSYSSLQAPVQHFNQTEVCSIKKVLVARHHSDVDLLLCLASLSCHYDSRILWYTEFTAHSMTAWSPLHHHADRCISPNTVQSIRTFLLATLRNKPHLFCLFLMILSWTCAFNMLTVEPELERLGCFKITS